jgi:hypothetical protein
VHHQRASAIAAVFAAGLLCAPAAPASAGVPQVKRLYDYAAQGVIIWSDPWAGSGRNGLGYTGQGFESDRVEVHGTYRCDLSASDAWHHGRNVTTGVLGWVPACDLADPNESIRRPR